jgi:hypothetical protein
MRVIWEDFEEASPEDLVALVPRRAQVGVACGHDGVPRHIWFDNKVKPGCRLEEGTEVGLGPARRAGTLDGPLWFAKPIG